MMTFIPARKLTEAEKKLIAYWAEKILEVGPDKGAIAVCLDAFLLEAERLEL